MRRHLHRPSPAFVIACVALFCSLSTGALAARTLITGRDVKNGSLTGTDIKHKSIGSKDIAPSQTAQALRSMVAGERVAAQRSQTTVPGNWSFVRTGRC